MRLWNQIIFEIDIVEILRITFNCKNGPVIALIFGVTISLPDAVWTSGTDANRYPVACRIGKWDGVG